jgi:hypothetical protein
MNLRPQEQCVYIYSPGFEPQIFDGSDRNPHRLRWQMTAYLVANDVAAEGTE